MTNPAHPLSHLIPENLELLELIRQRDRVYLLEPERILPILRPCRVRVLLVADGGLDFSVNDFGLRTFVHSLQSMPGFYVRFEITVAHINNVSDDAVMLGHSGIARSIKQFKFDEPSHFGPHMYDQVWLFGIATFYSRGDNPSGRPYPSNRLGDSELRALAEFMNSGGGLFATGDHGELGICLSGSVPRARSMRIWDDTSPDNAINEVSMSGPRRNDTNRLGPSIGSQFNDQSDDVPQTITPKLYRRWASWWRVSYPHPLLCGPRGMITVLPDHPHEGQCITPTNTSRTDTFDGFTIVEYPPGSGGAVRPLPEVIATALVLAGTTSGTKSATEAHSFGAISAYNGHSAGVGRVVTDATWHHFVNVNLVGDSSTPTTDPKHFGFFATATGQAYLEDIKAYYRNIAVWLSRPALIACMRRRICWGLLWHHRVMEAVMTRPELALGQAKLPIFFDIGRHARDVLGYYTGRCQAITLVLDLLAPVMRKDFLRRLDPWTPLLDNKPPIPEPDPLPWFDLEPILDAALGGALVALREEFPEPHQREKISDSDLEKVIERGVKTAIDLSFRSVAMWNKEIGSLFMPSETVSVRAKKAKRKG